MQELFEFKYSLYIRVFVQGFNLLAMFYSCLQPLLLFNGKKLAMTAVMFIALHIFNMSLLFYAHDLKYWDRNSGLWVFTSFL